VCTEGRLDGEQHRRDSSADAGDGDEPAPVHRVGEDAAEESEDDGRDGGGDPDRAHPHGVLRELPHLVHHRDHGDLAAEALRRGARPDTAERRV
jgi:hypothetical protein